MADKTKQRGTHPGTVSLPDQEDEADILADVAADGVGLDENGKPLVTDAQLKELGAADAESVRTNRKVSAYVKAKRSGKEGITFSSDNPLLRYEVVLRTNSPDTLTISVVRRSGGPEETYMIKSRPGSGEELYSAIEQIHGVRGTSEYEIRCFDTVTKQHRMQGARIVMPDTRPPQQQGQPMPQPPYGYPPPGYPQPPAPSATTPQPPIHVHPAAGTDPIALVKEILNLVQAQQPAAAPSAAPAVDPMILTRQILELVQSTGAAAPQPQIQGTDPIAIARQIVEMTRPRGAAPQAAPAQVPAYASPTPPATEAPPGSMWAWMPTANCFALVPAPTPGGGGGPMRRPPYFADRDRGQYQPPQPPPQRQPSPAEQFRESIQSAKTMMRMADEFQDVFGRRGGEAAPPEPQHDDPPPVRVVKTEFGEAAYDEEGNLRWGDSAFLNLGRVLKWVGEQREAIQSKSAEPRRKLPDGYVEVGPGYKPPPGYRAVEVDPSQVPYEDDLPPPPENVPPPINQPAAPPASWGMPTIPK